MPIVLTVVVIDHIILGTQQTPSLGMVFCTAVGIRATRLVPDCRGLRHLWGAAAWLGDPSSPAHPQANPRCPEWSARSEARPFQASPDPTFLFL